MPREFTSVGVIGLGTMGAGIAEIFARNGYQVVGVEVNEETLGRGRQHLQNSTDRAVSRGKLSETEQAELLGRVTLTTERRVNLPFVLVLDRLPALAQLQEGSLIADGALRPGEPIALSYHLLCPAPGKLRFEGVGETCHVSEQNAPVLLRCASRTGVQLSVP